MNPIVIRSLRWVALGLGGLVLTFAFALACTFVYLAPSLPTAENLHRVQMAVPLRVYDRSGGLISQIGEERRIPVQFEDIPMLVRQAVLAAEDDRFFEHSGFEWTGILRAVLMNVVTADAGQGGSTISQQAARNLFLTLDKTLRRKLSEVFITYRMETDFTKEQILAIYLTRIYFGQRSYGVAAAAETYYGKRLDELTVAQAATLAGIIQLPSRQNPITSPKNAEARRAYVLRRMTELGYIDATAAEAAAKEPVLSRGSAPLIDTEAAYIAELARQEVVRRYGEAAVNAGIKVITTIDGRAQIAGNRAVRLGLLNYDRRHGYRGHLGTLELGATPTEQELDAGLAEYRTVSMLQPAVVLNVGDTSATVHVRHAGEARIAWEGMSWAAKALRNGVAARPRKPSEVLKRGDVIHVVSNGRGSAELAQVPKAQAALVAIDPFDGAIVTLVGGFDFYSNQFNRATQANRQPGSGFKPFLYSAALEQGYTASTVVLDAPVIVDNSLEENWRPSNSDRSFRGPMRLREALVASRNPVSIRLLQDIGWEAFIPYAERFGFNVSSMPRNLTLALGSQSVTPLQMASGFAVFANGGFRVEPYFISRIEDANGEVLYEATPRVACSACERPAEGPPPVVSDAVLPMADAVAPMADAVTSTAPANPIDGVAGDTAQTAPVDGPGTQPSLALQPAMTPYRALGLDDVPDFMRDLASFQGGPGFLAEERLAPRVISAQNAWLMSDILHDVTTRGTAASIGRAFNRDDLSGKTGTSNDGRDNWFNGYNAGIVASVWVGHDDYQPLGEREQGATTAVPIWTLYMREALRGMPSTRMARPGGLVDLRVSAQFGTRTGAGDPEAITETFMLNHLPGGAALGAEFDTEGTAPAGQGGAPLF